MNGLLFQGASHQIDDIPGADFMARFGQERSPSACLIWHIDKTVDWLQRELAAWREPVR
jgi:hypothetical protein